jgi:hypothetical protein
MPVSPKKRALSRSKLPSALPGDLVLATSEINELDAPGSAASVSANAVLSTLFGEWTQNQARELEPRISVAEPEQMACNDLRRFLTRLADPSDTVLPDYLRRSIEELQKKSGTQLHVVDEAVSELRHFFGRWSQVQDSDVMRIFLSAEAATNGEAEEYLAGLKLSPNRVFTWRLISPWSWPMNMQTFRQLLWVQRYEFIADCFHDFGRPLPIMECSELCHGQTDSQTLEATVRMALSPVEFAYALSYGVFQVGVTDQTRPNGVDNPLRLSINPLFARSR